MLVCLAGTGPDDAGEDGGAADRGERRHPLAEEEGRGQEREDRIEIDVIGGTDVPELIDDQVPGNEARQGGHETQEEEVAPDGERPQELQREAAVGAEEERDDGQEPVEEDFPGSGDRTVAARHLAHEQAVQGPAEGRADGEKVAEGRHAEAGALEGDERHTGDGEDRTADERPAQPDFLQGVGEAAVAETPVDQGEDGREKRGGTDQERHVAGLRMGQRRILREEVEGAAGDAQEQEHDLLFPAEPQRPVAPGQEDI